MNMKLHPPVWILGPSNQASRRRAAAAMETGRRPPGEGLRRESGAGGSGAPPAQQDLSAGPAPGAALPGPGTVDGAALKTALRDMRRRTAGQLSSLAQDLRRSLADCTSVKTCWAADAAAAARYIAGLAEPDTAIIANRSSTVLGEIAPKLAELGRQVYDSYLDEFGPFDKSIHDCWDLPRLIENGITGNFEVLDGWQAGNHPPGHGRRLKDCIAVLGITAASAADGSLYFVQHAGNIGETLLRAARIVFVIALDKLAPGREEALFQARCTGIFGLESMLLGLKSGVPDSSRLDGLSEHAGEDQEVHFIILDNGRSRLPGTAYEELLDCIGCRSCLNQCPVGNHMMDRYGRWSPRDHLFLYLQGEPLSLNSCLHCEACRTECPLEIDLPGLMWRAQEDRGLARGLRERLMGDPEVFARAGSLLAPVANAFVRSSPGNLVIKDVLGLDRQRPLPCFQSPTLTKWFASGGHAGVPLSQGGSPNRKEAGGRAGRSRRKAAYYAGCFATYYQPEVGRALVHMLQMAGVEVVMPEQRCCGMPMMAARNYAGARRNAALNATSLAPLAAGGYDIVTTCPSCNLMLKQQCRYLAAGTAALSDCVFDSSQYLLMLIKDGTLSLDAARWDGQVIHHLPCHIKIQGLQQEASGLLSSIPGLSLDRTSSICCGMAGYHGYKRPHARLAGQIGARLFADLDRRSQGRIVTSCAACRMQIEWGTGRKATHPVMLLQEACEETANRMRTGTCQIDCSVM